MTAFTLHLMRHGAPVGAGRLLGHTDAAATDEGCAACLARARELEVDAVVCSDLVRARDPADMIAASHGLPLRIDPRWRELDFGAWDGAHPGELDTARLAAFWNDPLGHAPPQGETWHALVARVGAALEEIGAPTLVVTHAGAMRAALSCLFGLDYRQSWAFDLPYTALISLRIWPGAQRTALITALAT
ncbi:histidine phosphatase family protein [Sphingobium aquiterrae]|uniref:histidine phosphatase family protein n=1 Tax=Sphingobium aquiterrae TaxID=2038656 RepID=UPI003019452B